MFTDRFIMLPIKVFSQQQKDLTGKEELDDTMSRVDPNEICEYFSAFEDDQDGTSVLMKSGHRFVCYLPIEDFEQKINEWQSKQH